MLSKYNDLEDREFLDRIDLRLEEMGYEPTNKVRIEDIGDLYLLLADCYLLKGEVREAIGTLIISNGVDIDEDGENRWMVADPHMFITFIKDMIYEDPVGTCGDEKLAAKCYIAITATEHFVKKHCLYTPQ